MRRRGADQTRELTPGAAGLHAWFVHLPGERVVRGGRQSIAGL